MQALKSNIDEQTIHRTVILQASINRPIRTAEGAVIPTSRIGKLLRC